LPTRVLILTASVGAGHDRPARWLRVQLEEERPGVEVLVEDCLPAMGRTIWAFSEAAPRIVFYRVRWLWDLAYWVFTAPSPVRSAGQRLLTQVGGPGLLRLIERARPDVVVSVYPQASEVLARLRLSGRLDRPVVACITDVAGLDYWAHRGIDVHLVSQPEAIDEVRRVAGATCTVHAVRGFTDPRFYAPRSRDDSRDALGLPHDERIVLVSGGGWGVGDLEGAVEVALTLDPPVRVVALTGLNQRLQTSLEARFGDDALVRVEGFTEQMADWLAAADAVIHSTGGLTAYEALLRGCPMVSYGWGRGHIRKHNEAFRRHGLATVAATRPQLQRALADALARGPMPTAPVDGLPTAASFVLAAGDAR
jgi:processive 1,2-diacylglycerol beta-glucosyltransferase